MAIIGVLIAVSIPIFTSQLKKARRAGDLDIARSVRSVLTYALIDGFLRITDDKYCGAGEEEWHGEAQRRNDGSPKSKGRLRG